MDIGAYGIWTFNLDLVPSAQAIEHVAELDELGFGAVWIPEAVGREPFASAAILLRGGSRIVVGTGVATIWSRDAMATAAAQRTICEAYPDRFLLGLGVSHQPMVEAVRGHEYDKPYTAMREYLDRMDNAMFVAAQPTSPPERVLAALRPRMLRLSAERANGALPYFVPPEHTAFARETLGDGPMLAVEQAVVFETDAARARELARTHTSIYTGLPNYTGNLRRFGFDDDDFVPGGSDRLVDAIVAWGDMDAVLSRVRAHRDAGADHVCMQVIADGARPPLDAWRSLAEALELSR
jgi:probable F420-dependent oxidoreductase